MQFLAPSVKSAGCFDVEFMKEAHFTSGDIVADRRFEFGRNLFQNGDAAGALAMFTLAVERAPQWTPGWLSLGRARAATFDPAGAIEAWRECLRLDPKDAVGAGLELARIDASVSIDAAPQAYVANLFDAYAEEFDKALVERLGYCAPQHLAGLAVMARNEREDKFSRVLDLGCGTGLAGEAIATQALRLEGVDLSNGMIEQAEAKGFYDALTRSDIQSFLYNAENSYDLILAADVLIYFGDLLPLFKSVADKLLPDGVFAFSLEYSPGQDWTILESLRFAHSGDYVLRQLRACGLELIALERDVLRKDRGADIEGLLVVAKKPFETTESAAQEKSSTEAENIAKMN